MKKLALFLFGIVLATACASSPAAVRPTTEDIPEMTADQLPNHGPAPELTNDTWLNVDAPLRLAELRGQVVLLEMWTFG